MWRLSNVYQWHCTYRSVSSCSSWDSVKSLDIDRSVSLLLSLSRRILISTGCCPKSSRPSMSFGTAFTIGSRLQCTKAWWKIQWTGWSILCIHRIYSIVGHAISNVTNVEISLTEQRAQSGPPVHLHFFVAGTLSTRCIVARGSDPLRTWDRWPCSSSPSSCPRCHLHHQSWGTLR